MCDPDGMELHRISQIIREKRFGGGFIIPGMKAKKGGKREAVASKLLKVANSATEERIDEMNYSADTSDPLVQFYKSFPYIGRLITYRAVLNVGSHLPFGSDLQGASCC